MLGIFDIHMRLIYGEGRENAEGRLREAINRKEKGMLFSFSVISYIEVIDLDRNQI